MILSIISDRVEAGLAANLKHRLIFSRRGS